MSPFAAAVAAASDECLWSTAAEASDDRRAHFPSQPNPFCGDGCLLLLLLLLLLPAWSDEQRRRRRRHGWLSPPVSAQLGAIGARARCLERRGAVERRSASTGARSTQERDRSGATADRSDRSGHCPEKHH